MKDIIKDALLEMLEKEVLPKDAMFDTSSFFYISGRFPQATIADVVLAIEEVREKIEKESEIL